jgi:hypothetical protein
MKNNLKEFELEATRLRSGRFCVRPKGALGMCGSATTRDGQTKLFTAAILSAWSERDAIQRVLTNRKISL